MALCITLYVTLLLLTRCHSLDESIFRRDTICNVQERIDHGCSRGHQGNFSSCLAECRLQSSCIGVSLKKTTRKCFMHELCSPSLVCDTPDVEHKYYAKHCLHGEWNRDTHSCDCNLATLGERCDKALHSCYQIALPSESYHIVYIDPKQDGDLYKIQCLSPATIDYSNVIVLKNSGGMIFNRTWNEYVHGFHLEDQDNYWIGLQTLHVLTTYTTYNVMTFILVFPHDSVIYRVHYDFVVSNITENFLFHIGNSVDHRRELPAWDYGPVGPCMDFVQGYSFSTWDRDNDGNASVNCASQAGSGWWHPHDCDNPCNFMSWGLEDWENMPIHQRFSALGVDMQAAAPNLHSFTMYLESSEWARK